MSRRDIHAKRNGSAFADALRREATGLEWLHHAAIGTNPINGMSVSIEDFEKLSCVAAQNKPGFVCDYRVTVKTGFHLNEGTADGHAHAQAVTTLMILMNGGRPLVESSAVTARFVHSKGEWIRLPD